MTKEIKITIIDNQITKFPEHRFSVNIDASDYLCMFLCEMPPVIAREIQTQPKIKEK